jgi:lysophospholipase L1-like esterase
MNASKPKFVLCLVCSVIFAASGVVGAEKTKPQQPKAPPADQTVWHDCKQLGVEGKGWTDTLSFYDRLPAKAQGKAPASVWSLSHLSAGLCVRFTTDASSIQVRWTLLGNDAAALPHMPATGVSGVDFYVKKGGRWAFVGNGRPAAGTNASSFNVPSGEQYLLYLPLYNGVKSVEIGIPPGRKIAVCAASSAHPKPIVIYGTSITQGGCASRPGMAWTSIVGRQLDTPVINLGFSGSGKMEPEMGDLLAELDPSVYVLDCIWNMSPEEVKGRIQPFVEKLRAAHPNTPILLAEDSSFANECPTEKGRLLRDAYQQLTAAGVKDLHFLASEGMLGDDRDGTVDGCHPNDLGMMRMADAFANAIRPILLAVQENQESTVRLPLSPRSRIFRFHRSLTKE